MEDLRSWLKRVDARGKLETISGAGSEDEIGPITEMAARHAGTPVLLFDNIPGFSPGYRVCSNFNAASFTEDPVMRQALKLGSATSREELFDVLKGREREWEIGASKYPPKWVEEGPVMEEVLRGDEVDLLRYPSPKWHELDGGTFIGTACVFITQDPDSGAYDFGAFRAQVFDKRRVGTWIAGRRQAWINMKKWWAKGKPSPTLISVGHHPIFIIVASAHSAQVSGGQDFGYLGAMMGEALPAVKGELTGLPVPADAELVLEGFIKQGDMMDEGPFGEWTGYYGGTVEPEPYMVVERVYQRKDPIILGTAPLKYKYPHTILPRVGIMARLEAAGVEGVVAVSNHPYGGTLMAVVKLRQMYAGHVKEVLQMVGGLIRNEACRWIIAVDEDIDINDWAEVTWAMASRADPAEDIDIIRRTMSTRLDPMVPARTTRERSITNRALIDACIPYERFSDPNDNAFGWATMSREMWDKTMAKWGKRLRITEQSKRVGEHFPEVRGITEHMGPAGPVMGA